MKPGDLVRSRSPRVRVWDENQDDCITIDVYPKKFELLLVLGGVTRDGYHHRVLTSGGIVGYVLGSEMDLCNVHPRVLGWKQ